MPGLHFVPWHRGSGCLGAAAPVTGAAADEYNLNVVDCNALTVTRLSLSHAGLPFSQWGLRRRVGCFVCFITTGPITKLCAWGEEESGGHVL